MRATGGSGEKQEWRSLIQPIVQTTLKFDTEGDMLLFFVSTAEQNPADLEAAEEDSEAIWANCEAAEQEENFDVQGHGVEITDSGEL